MQFIAFVRAKNRAARSPKGVGSIPRPVKPPKAASSGMSGFEKRQLFKIHLNSLVIFLKFTSIRFKIAKMPNQVFSFLLLLDFAHRKHPMLLLEQHHLYPKGSYIQFVQVPPFSLKGNYMP